MRAYDFILLQIYPKINLIFLIWFFFFLFYYFDLNDVVNSSTDMDRIIKKKNRYGQEILVAVTSMDCHVDWRANDSMPCGEGSYFATS